MTPPGHLLVCFAVKEESQFFVPVARSKNVRVLLTGIGKENARAAIRQAFDCERPTQVISAGFAGGLNPALQTGDLVFHQDEGFALEQRLNPQHARPAVFHCAERVITTAAEKRGLRAETGADAVEMESQCIREFCQEEGVPAATLRVILDTAEQDLPLDFNRLSGPDGRVRPERVALALALSPAKIGPLLRLRKEVNQCARNLAEALGRVC